MNRERQELQQKRKQVEDACGDIASFVKRLENERKVMVDQLQGAGSDRGTPRRRSWKGSSGNHEDLLAGSGESE